MGWKAFSILIKPAINIRHEILLQTLGVSKFVKIDDEPYEIAIYPDRGNIFIGSYKDTLIISNFDLPQLFFDIGLTEIEKKLITIFPDSEICAVSLHSGVNLWAYAIIRKGKKIRARMGDADNGTTLDFGEPLQEEQDLLSKSTLNDNGQREYYLNNSNESYTEDQVGENFVFDIYKRYTGKSLDANDELLFETILSGYKVL